MSRRSACRSVQDNVTLLNSGERLVAAGNIASTLESAARGNPIAVVYPADGVVLVDSPSAILKGTKHPNAARLLMEFLASPRVSEIMVAEFGETMHKSVPPNPRARSLANVKVRRLTQAEIVAGMDNIKTFWRELFGSDGRRDRARRASKCPFLPKFVSRVPRCITNLGDLKALDCWRDRWPSPASSCGCCSPSLSSCWSPIRSAASSLTSVQDDATGAATLRNYIGAFGSSRHLTAFVNTLTMGGAVVLLAGFLLLAVPLAWAVARTDMPGRELVRIAALAVFIMPPTCWRSAGSCSPGRMPAGSTDSGFPSPIRGRGR